VVSVNIEIATRYALATLIVSDSEHQASPEGTVPELPMTHEEAFSLRNHQQMAVS